MMKSQLADVVSAKTGRQKAVVEAVLESVLAAIVEALEANQPQICAGLAASS
jgi:nucleoid DNA-binding protein